jgi:hypothetical protein
MSRVGLAHVPDDLVAAIVRRALSDSGSTLQARLDLSLVSKCGAALTPRGKRAAKVAIFKPAIRLSIEFASSRMPGRMRINANFW